MRQNVIIKSAKLEAINEVIKKIWYNQQCSQGAALLFCEENKVI